MSAEYRIDPESGCWIWLLSTNDEYPSAYAHRRYWEEANGPRPAGHDIHHKCRNTLCVNPEHLEALTEREHDIEHFLHDRGYTIDTVREVRADRALGLSIRQIMTKRGIPFSTVREWCLGIRWSELVGNSPAPIPAKTCEREDCDNPVISRTLRPDKRFCCGNCRGVHNSRRAWPPASSRTQSMETP